MLRAMTMGWMVAAVGLGVAGCAPPDEPLVGTWELVDISWGDLTYSETFTVDGGAGDDSGAPPSDGDDSGAPLSDGDDSGAPPADMGGGSIDCHYTERLEAELVIDEQDGEDLEDLEGELDLLFRQQLSGCAEESVSDRATFDVEAEREDGDDYELDLDGDYHFDCELDADELDCRDELGDDWVFEKVE